MSDHGFYVGVDEPTVAVSISVRYRTDAVPADVVEALAKACGAAAERLTNQLGVVCVD